MMFKLLKSLFLIEEAKLKISLLKDIIFYLRYLAKLVIPVSPYLYLFTVLANVPNTWKNTKKYNRITPENLHLVNICPFYILWIVLRRGCGEPLWEIKLLHQEGVQEVRTEASAEERKSEIESVADTTDNWAGLKGNYPLSPSQTSRSEPLCPEISWVESENSLYSRGTTVRFWCTQGSGEALHELMTIL